MVQSMPDASPAKWHRAHVTWFFEQFLLRPFVPSYRPFDERFAYLFNSYYVAAGPRHARPQRGLITRPGVAETTAYRAHVDAAVAKLIETTQEPERVFPIVEIGLNHEQQHQELMLTDLLHAFAQNPTHPAYDPHWQWPRGKRADSAGDGAGRRHSHHRPRRRRASRSTTSGRAHQVLLQPVRVAPRAGDQRRVARIHGRRRLCDAEPLAVGRLGDGRGTRLERAGLLAAQSTAPGLR